MGKKKKGKSQKGSKPRKDEDSDFMHDEVDDFLDQRQMIPLEREAGNGRLEEDDILDNEVMALSEDEDEDDLEESENEDEELDMSSDLDNGDDDEEDEQDVGERWGKHKKTYYNTDYVDSEIVSSDNEAKEEEEEVLLMQKKKRKELNEDEFLDTFGSILSGKGSTSKGDKKSKSDLNELDENVERLSKDVQDLSTREKLEVLMNDSPELLKLLETFRAKIVELHTNIAPLVQRVREAELPKSPGISYLEAKFHLLLSYCINICFYLLRKAEGKTVKDHPVITQLVRIRAILEKLRPLDNKLKYQIEKLLKMSTLGAQDASAGAEAIDERLAHKPNLKAFAAPSQEGAQEVDSGKKYTIPKRDALKMEDEREKLAAKRLKEMQRVKRSKVAQALLEEFGDRPETDSSARVTKGNRVTDEIDREEEELRRFEEENFVRLDQKRLEIEKKRKKKAKNAPDYYEDLTDFGDYSVLSNLRKDDDEDISDKRVSNPKRSFQDMLNTVERDKPVDDDELLPRKKKQKVEAQESNFDEDAMDLDSTPSKKSKSKALDMDDDGDNEIEDDDMIDDDAYYKEVEQQQKADKQKKKAEKVREGEEEGDEDVEEGGDGKRGITYEMSKNKGTSKRSKKAVRNPRIKRKVQYEKAVKKRNSQVQKHRDQNQRYSGEATGIKSNVVKSRQL